MSINDRIAALRKTMNEKNLSAYIIPSEDPHQSEYVAEHWKSREWISGFTGSAGTVVITHDHGGLWTDSRYFLQSETELANSEMELHKIKVQGVDEYISWLNDHLQPGSKVGIDEYLFTPAQADSFRKQLSKNNNELIKAGDLISEVRSDRPDIPRNLIFSHDEMYAGKTAGEKLEAVREVMRTKGADWYFCSTLDDISWMFNIRGTDVSCNPVMIAYALIGLDHADLFIYFDKVPQTVANHLENADVRIRDYDDIGHALSELSATDKIWIDKNKISEGLFQQINATKVEGHTIPLKLKAVKNSTEIKHLKQAHIQDGQALIKMFMWLEKIVNERPIPETEVAEKLAHFRKETSPELYYGESFDAIVGWKGNGAIVHYRAQPDTCANIHGDGVLLVDSGGQYLNGTTDITRTIVFGNPTDEQKDRYTRVLKGHIGLGQLKFPQGTTGVQMDILARQHLWANDLNYGHGTGHGVGFFLNVHEPPQGIIPGVNERGTTAHVPGMFTSNEPGFYKANQYGMRIENLVLCVEGKKTDFGQFLHFDTITLFPISTDMIEKSLMTDAEIAWLNEYHEEVFEKLSVGMNEDQVEWLREKCAAI